ncbi:MAG: carbohydrate ABC transporter permease [Clostridia bacterium]|nr:carbohydrate ABC transporter permease [Clostridia bacterium]
MNASNQATVYRPKVKRAIHSTLWYVVMALLSIVFALPFLYILSTSFKTPEQCIVYPPQFIPKPFTLRSFQTAFSEFPFIRYVLNSLLVTSLSVVGTLFSCSLVAFGFARINARGRNFWFTLLLSTMMIPGFVTLLPLYTIYVKLKWINTYLPLVVPAFLAMNSFSIFLLRQFFMGFPVELDEAAAIDGCSCFGVLYRILLPNAKTVMFVVAIFALVNSWNDFFGPMIYLNNNDMYTLAVGLILFKSSHGATLDLGPMMSVSLVSILPVLILYIVAQKYFVQGIVTTGLK